MVISTNRDMQLWASKHHLPSTLEAVEDKPLYVVPMNYSLYCETDAVCLTGKTQVRIHARYMPDTYMIHT